MDIKGEEGNDVERILIIEDEGAILYALSELLREEGFRTVTAESLQEAFRKDIGEYCLILLDLGLPDGEGWTFLEKLYPESGEKEAPPVIVLTAREDERDIIRGLDMGADDYVTKPFKMGVLISRIRAVLRRRGRGAEAAQILTCGNIVLDKQKTRITAGGREIILTAGEFRLLQYMMENKERTLTRNGLLARLWDNDGEFVNDNTLTVMVKRLREKLGSGSRKYIKTVRGIGYKMEDGDD